jgi:hypothetical protein
MGTKLGLSPSERNRDCIRGRSAEKRTYERGKRKKVEKIE